MAPALRDRVRAFFEAEPAAQTVYLFGSTARGSARSDSDIDVAVLFDPPPTPTLMGPALSLAGRLEQLVERPVDLIVLNSASADLVHRVLRDGDLIIDRQPGQRIRFEVAKRNEYFDLQPIRDLYRRVSSRTTASPQ
jgi:predicted nucleotidyltransferase